MPKEYFLPKGIKAFLIGRKRGVAMKNTVLPHEHNAKDIPESIKKELNNIGKFQLVADIFKQLGDTTRIRLFWLLCHCEECVINISAMLDMSSPAVSHHLRLLRSSGLVSSRRDGKEVYYHASDTEQSQLLHKMIERIIEVACPINNIGKKE